METNEKEHINPPVFSKDITLLDYFASQAISAFVQSDIKSLEADGGFLADYIIPKLAKNCYKLAEAMLREREKHLKA